MRLNENSTSNEAEPDTTIVPKPVMPDIVLSSANEDSMSSNPDPSVFAEKAKGIILKNKGEDGINKDSVGQQSGVRTQSIDLDATESQWETESEEEVAPPAATTEHDDDDDWETESEEEVLVPQASNKKPEQTKVADFKQVDDQIESKDVQKVNTAYFNLKFK